MKVNYILHKSSQGERIIVNIGGMIFYKSTGSNSSHPGTWFPMDGFVEKEHLNHQGLVNFFGPPITGIAKPIDVRGNLAHWPINDEPIVKDWKQRCNMRDKGGVDLIERCYNLQAVIISCALHSPAWANQYSAFSTLREMLQERYPDLIGDAPLEIELEEPPLYTIEPNDPQILADIRNGTIEDNPNYQELCKLNRVFDAHKRDISIDDLSEILHGDAIGFDPRILQRELDTGLEAPSLDDQALAAATTVRGAPQDDDEIIILDDDDIDIDIEIDVDDQELDDDVSLMLSHDEVEPLFRQISTHMMLQAFRHFNADGSKHYTDSTLNDLSKALHQFKKEGNDYLISSADFKELQTKAQAAGVKGVELTHTPSSPRPNR